MEPGATHRMPVRMTKADQTLPLHASDPGDSAVRSTPTTDEDAWAARVSAGIAAGSRESLGSLYEAKFDLLYRTVRSFTRRDESFALDCVQDAMIRVATTMRRIETIATLDAWLRRVVLSAALDQLRRERAMRDRELTRSLGSEEQHIAPIADIEREIARLDAGDRGLLRLRFAGGLTLRQIAEHLGLSSNAVDSRLRRLLTRLRLATTAPRRGDELP
jgi:RNA polymerase sigma factor (sigma-70 family)